jgi:hypothetical protein
VSYNKLHFNAIQVSQKDGAVTVNPNFLCPKCGAAKTVQQKTVSAVQVASEKVLLTDASKQPLETVDFNKLQTYVMPCCGSKIVLYTAIYKTKDGQTQTCISTEPIAVDWHVQQVEAMEVAKKI